MRTAMPGPSSGSRKSRATWAPGTSSSRAWKPSSATASCAMLGGPNAPAPPKAGARRTWPSSSGSSPRAWKELQVMPTEVRVPTLGESVVEATVGAWLAQEGQTVEAGQTLVQLETEKVNVDVAADAAGVLGRIQHQEGDTVHPGDVLAVLEPAAAGSSGPAPAAVSAPLEDRAHASPVARRMAEEHGLDLSGVQGTGTGGRVTRDDVERLIARTDGAPLSPPPPPVAPVAAPADARGETRV